MQEFAKPENYEGNDLLTIKKLAEKLRLENSSIKNKDYVDKYKNENILEENEENEKLEFKELSKNSTNSNSTNYQRKARMIRRNRFKSRPNVLLTSGNSEIDNTKQELSSNYILPTVKINPSRILFGIVKSTKTEQKIKIIARTKFKWIIRMVLIWTQYLNQIVERAMKHQKKHLDSLRSLKELANSIRKSNNESLDFDKYYFVANKDMDLTQDHQKILTLDPKLRSEENVLQVMYGLNALSSFNEYPLHLKKKLCTVAYFRKIEPNRVIVRQGHIAEYFYFIISGSAIVTITSDGQIRTVNKLSKGNSFGELALLHHSCRTASVVSLTPMQLLAIERTDFFNIFMSSSNNSSLNKTTTSYPEHIMFLKEHKLFKNFNVDLFINHPEICITHFYKSGTVICSNDIISQWVYVVKSGSCTVVKEIKIPLNKPRNTSKNTSSRSSNDSKISNQKIKSYDDKSIKNFHLDPSEYQSIYCYNNYVFVPTQLNMATGTQKSIIKYLWKERTQLQPGDYFYMQEQQYETNHSNHIHLTDVESEKDEDNKSVFLKLNELSTGDTIGFSSLVFGPEDTFQKESLTSVSIISNRVELVLISKKFLTSNSSELFIKDIRDNMSHYPSHEALLSKYNTQTQWNRYKLERIDSVITKLD